MANMDRYFAGHMINFVNYYDDLMESQGDPTMKNWPLMFNPIPTILICLVYMYFCKFVVPMMVKNRKPLQLRYFMIVYYFGQMCLNGWIFHEYFQSGWFCLNNFRCQPVDYSKAPMGQRLANACWWYFISKFMEMLDTVIFLLTKKYQHVGDMHIIHHSLMPISVWAGLKFAPGNHSTLFALVNSFVHVVMYFYYMLSAIGPRNQTLLSWRKYLTGLQVLQFLIVLGHQFQFAFTECKYSKGFLLWIGLHGLFFFIVFTDFYTKKYKGALLKEMQGERGISSMSDRGEDVTEDTIDDNNARPRSYWGEDREVQVTRHSPEPFTLTEELPSGEKEE